MKEMVLHNHYHQNNEEADIGVTDRNFELRKTQKGCVFEPKCTL